MHVENHLMRHRWIVWMYTPTSGNIERVVVPCKNGVIVSSRRLAKRLAEKHANKSIGNTACWCRYSLKIRGNASQLCNSFFLDVTSTYHLGQGVIKRVLCDLSAKEFVDIFNSTRASKRYFSACHNPLIIGDRKKTAYRNYSVWRVGNYLLEITTNYFWSESEANDFSKKISRLVLGENFLQFLDAQDVPLEVLAKHGEWVSEFQDDITIKQIKSAQTVQSLSLIHI